MNWKRLKDAHKHKWKLLISNWGFFKIILPVCKSILPLPLRYGTPAPPISVRKPSRGMMASYWHCVSRGNKLHTCTKQHVVIKRCMSAGNHQPSHRTWLCDIFFVSIETGYTVALQTAPSSWVTFTSPLLIFKGKHVWIVSTCYRSCVFIFLLCVFLLCILCRCGTSRPCRKSILSVPMTTLYAHWSPPTTCCSAAPSRPLRYSYVHDVSPSTCVVSSFKTFSAQASVYFPTKSSQGFGQKNG